MCDISDNIYQIEFVRFKIRDVETDLTLFEVAKSPEDDKLESNSSEEDQNRFVRYNFASAFLRLKTVGATYVKLKKNGEDLVFLIFVVVIS